MVAAPLVDPSVRPEWLFELANMIQARACPSASECASDVSGSFTPDSELERAIKRALLERVQKIGVTDGVSVTGRKSTAAFNSPRVATRAIGVAVEEAERLLRAGYMKPWSVEAVARRVGCNRTDLEAGFRRRGLQSVHAYLIACRMEAAKNLLRTTAWRVEEIAKEVGYRSKTSLYEHFRRTIGISPEQYRERWKPSSPTPDVLALLQGRDSATD